MAMQPLSPEDREFFHALSGERPGSPAEQALRADMLELGRLKHEIEEDDEALSSEQEAHRTRFMDRLRREGLTAKFREFAGASDLARQAQFQDAANDREWSSVSLPLLAAASEQDPTQPLRAESPPGNPERWSLTQAPVIGQDACYLVFKAQGESIARCVGALVRVEIGGRIFDLGEVQDDGIAELRVDGRIDMSTWTLLLGKPRGRT